MLYQCFFFFFFNYFILLQVSDYLHCTDSPGHRIDEHPLDSAGAWLDLFADPGPDGLVAANTRQVPPALCVSEQ